MSAAGLALLLVPVAFVWGFAEAILFFVVADVAATFAAARHGFRVGARSAVAAAGGALLGGLVVYAWAAADPTGLEFALDHVPAVSPGQIGSVKGQVAQHWTWAVFAGGFTGDPYKLYAAAAGEQGVPLHVFALASLVARLARFLIAAAVAYAVATGLRRAGLQRAILPLWGVFWIGFYAWYLSVTPW